MYKIDFNKIENHKLDLVHFIFVLIGIIFLYGVLLIGSYLGSWLLLGEGAHSYFYHELLLPYLIIAFPQCVILLVLWISIGMAVKEDNYVHAKTYLRVAKYSTALILIVEVSILFDYIFA